MRIPACGHAACGRWFASAPQSRVRPLDPTLRTAILPPLLARLDDPRVVVRQTAAEALARLADPAAVPALVAALQDTDPRVRENAALALGRTETSAAQDALLAATQDADVWVRICAARALVTTPAMPPNPAGQWKPWLPCWPIRASRSTVSACVTWPPTPCKPSARRKPTLPSTAGSADAPGRDCYIASGPSVGTDSPTPTQPSVSRRAIAASASNHCGWAFRHGATVYCSPPPARIAPRPRARSRPASPGSRP